MMLKTMRDFGLAIRDARKSKHLTQAQLATKLGTHQDWISNLETGRLENPSFGTILRALGVLGIQLNTDLGQRLGQDDSSFDTGDLALDEPAFLHRPSR